MDSLKSPGRVPRPAPARARRRPRARRDPPRSLRAYTNLSNTMWGLDRYEEALSYQEPGRVLAERTGYRYSLVVPHRSPRAHVLHLTGRWDELEALAREFEERRGEPGADASTPNFDFLRVLVEGVGRGDVDEAVRVAETLRKWEGSDDFQARNFIEVLFSVIAILVGRPAEANDRTERVLNAGRRSAPVIGCSRWPSISPSKLPSPFRISTCRGDPRRGRIASARGGTRRRWTRRSPDTPRCSAPRVETIPMHRRPIP